MNQRFAATIAALTLLAVTGAATLSGDFRLALLIFLAGLAVKTVIAWKRSQ